MALIDFKQIKHGQELMNAVDNAVEKTAVVTTPSEVPSDELIPSETYMRTRLDEFVASFTKQIDEPLNTNSEELNSLTLSSTPTNDPVKLVINGLEYVEGNDFTVDRSTGTITWTGNFPLTNDTVDTIKAVYLTNVASNDKHFPKAKHIIGMVLAEEGSGYAEVKLRHYLTNQIYTEQRPTARGTWKRIDQHFNEVDFDPNHGTWAGIHEVTTSLHSLLGKFIEIPTTWVKNEVISSGPYAGKNCWWIADGEAPGFHVHPAFIKPDGTPGKLRVGKYMATVPDNYDGDIYYEVEVDDAYYGFQTSTYNELRNRALTYNTADENGYRAYSIYDHHFLARMILTEFCNPNIMFSRFYDNSIHSYTDEWLEKIVGDHDYALPEQQLTDEQINIANDYHGIQCILGDNYACCILDGLTTLNGTYQLLSADGSGTMVETNIECPQYGTWVANCFMNKVNGVDFGDVFINDGTNVDDDIISSEHKSYEDDGKEGSTHISKGSFCDYQYIVKDCALATMYEEQYNYCGIFMLNSINPEANYCWRLVQVV